jgi:hypothetical protein
MRIAAHPRIDVEPRREAQATGAQRALAVGAIATFILCAVALGHLQSTVTARAAEILLLEQARFDLETRLTDTEYRLRVLWDDVRATQRKSE